VPEPPATLPPDAAAIIMSYAQLPPLPRALSAPAPTRGVFAAMPLRCATQAPFHPLTPRRHSAARCRYTLLLLTRVRVFAMPLLVLAAIDADALFAAIFAVLMFALRRCRFAASAAATPLLIYAAAMPRASR